MALSDEDLKKIGKLITINVGDALTQIVFPKFEELEKKMATKQDLAESEERITKRIDNLAEVVTDTRTNHERRIRRLEDEVGIEPEARLI